MLFASSRAVQNGLLAALFCILSVSGASAQVACGLKHDAICSLMDEDWQFYCRKQVNQVRELCRKAHGSERFGTHQQHCEVSCRAELLANDLDLRLRNAALEVVKQRGKDNEEWRTQATGFWGQFDHSPGTCDSAGVRTAHQTCKSLCGSEYARRDVAELQAMTKGDPLLPVVQPDFVCTPSPALGLFRAPDQVLIEQLYPPGHPRRSDKQ